MLYVLPHTSVQYVRYGINNESYNICKELLFNNFFNLFSIAVYLYIYLVTLCFVIINCYAMSVYYMMYDIV